MESAALNYFGNRITYQKLFDRIKETADAFTMAGIKRGEMVTILSLITPETILYLCVELHRCSCQYGIFILIRR